MSPQLHLLAAAAEPVADRAAAARSPAPAPKPPTAKPPTAPAPPAVIPAVMPRLRALSIRQPHAEAIMRGVKAVEYRSPPATTIRGRIYVYASESTDDIAAEICEEYGLSLAAARILPRGRIVGTVELYGADGDEWYLRAPERLPRPVKPQKRAQPRWFWPW